MPIENIILILAKWLVIMSGDSILFEVLLLVTEVFLNLYSTKITLGSIIKLKTKNTRSKAVDCFSIQYIWPSTLHLPCISVGKSRSGENETAAYSKYLSSAGLISLF